MREYFGKVGDAMAKRRNQRSGKRSNRNTLTKGEPNRASAPSLTKRESKRASKQSLPQAAAIVAFTEIEEAFFAAGESEPHLEQMAAESDAEAERARPSLWKRLFARAA